MFSISIYFVQNSNILQQQMQIRTGRQGTERALTAALMSAVYNMTLNVGDFM